MRPVSDFYYDVGCEDDDDDDDDNKEDDDYDEPLDDEIDQYKQMKEKLWNEPKLPDKGDVFE